jgi:hypothetical protein
MITDALRLLYQRPTLGEFASTMIIDTRTDASK